MKFYCLYSGGKDSTVAASVLQEQGLLAGCIAIDTKIRIPEWRDFVTQYCEKQNWPLKIYDTSEDYDRLVRKYGFPGPGAHGWFMSYLKGRGVQQFKSEHRGQCLASGVRKDESERRGRSTKEWSVMEGVPIYAPIFDWTTEKTWEYFNYHKHQRSPVYEILCISGDCLCGAFASPGERELIRDFYPEVFERIRKLEEETGEIWGARSCANRKRKKNSNALCVDCDLKEKTQLFNAPST